jgi:hypothetical protein
MKEKKISRNLIRQTPHNTLTSDRLADEAMDDANHI